MTRLSLVIPCYNESAVLTDTHARLSKLMQDLIASQQISSDSQIHYVDDGSKDATWALIQELASRDKLVVGIKLSRNYGHQNALLAGLMHAAGDAVITLDADLQDDLEAIPQMLKNFAAGDEVVYGIRRNRSQDSLFKRSSALAFYLFMKLMGTEVVSNHGDFRLLSRRAIEELKHYREVNLFLRGMIPLLGFRASSVLYDRQSRAAGESKYPLRRMLGFALDGMTSFSMVPLRLIGVMGLLIFLITSFMSAWVLAVTLFTDNNVPGWTSTVLPTYFLGGVQILCLGVIGEYLGKIYGELKARPRYIIEGTT